MNSSFPTFILGILLLVFLFIPAPVNAQQSQFDQANELMQDYLIEEAFDIYRSIESDGYQSGELYFNMALAAFYQDSLGLSKFYLLQAEKFDGTKTDAQQTLQFVNEQFDRRSAVLPKLPWVLFFDWLEKFAGQGLLSFFGLVILNLGVGAIIGSWFIAQGSVYLKWTGYTMTVFSLILIFCTFYLNYLDNRYATGVMIENQTVVYEHPRSGSALISNVYEGYTMSVDRHRSSEQDGWYYVRLENGMYGWIEDGYIRYF